MIKGQIAGGIAEGVSKAPLALVNGLLDVIEAPPKRLIENGVKVYKWGRKQYDSMSPEDQERLKEGARTLADVLIKLGKAYAKGKSEF